MRKQTNETWKQAAERLEGERDEAVGWLARVALGLADILATVVPSESEKIEAQKELGRQKPIYSRKEVYLRALSRFPPERAGELVWELIRLKECLVEKAGLPNPSKELEALARRAYELVAARYARNGMAGALPTVFGGDVETWLRELVGGLGAEHDLSEFLSDQSNLYPEGLRFRDCFKRRDGFNLLIGMKAEHTILGAVGQPEGTGWDWSATPLWSLASRLFPGKTMQEVETDARNWTVEGSGGPKGSRQMRRVVRVLAELCGDAEEGVSGWLKRMWGIVADDTTVGEMLRADWTPDVQVILDAMMAWAVEQWGHEARQGSGVEGVVHAVEARLEGYGVALPVGRRDSLLRAAKRADIVAVEAVAHE